MPRKARFNWSGIEENADGSYTAAGKNEKRRLLKSLHTSGYAVRSRRNPDRSWTVTTVGTMRPTGSTRRNPVKAGYHPRTRAFRMQNRYVPPQSQGRYIPLGQTRRYSGSPRPLYPHPRYRGSMPSSYYRRPSGPTYLQRYNKYLKERQEQKVNAKKNEEITNQKMLNERLIHEKAQEIKVARHAEFNAQRDLVKQEQELKIDQNKLQEAREKEVT